MMRDDQFLALTALSFAVAYALLSRAMRPPKPDPIQTDWIPPGQGEPPEALAQGPDTGEISVLLDELDAYLEAEGVAEYTSAREFCRLPNLPGTVYGIPPRSLWPNIVPTLTLFTWIRGRLGKPLALRGYRPPDYNELSKGAAKSMHMWASAIDIRPGSLAPEIRQEVAELAGTACRDNPQFRPGLGVYGSPPNSIHIDTGYRARTWGRGGEFL